MKFSHLRNIHRLIESEKYFHEIDISAMDQSRVDTFSYAKIYIMSKKFQSSCATIRHWRKNISKDCQLL
jgi:hypothetical protein